MIQNYFQYVQIEKTKLIHIKLDRYDQKKYSMKRRKLRDNLNIGEKVLVLAERIKKKPTLRKFYKQSVQNISYFNKVKTFLIRKKQTTDKITYYWLRETQTNRKVSKRFQRTDCFLLRAILLCKIIFRCNNLWKKCKMSCS